MAFDLGAIIAAGWDSMQYAYRSPAGWMAGAGNLDATDTGQSSSMARHDGATTIDFALPNPNVVVVPGDDAILGSFLFGSSEPLNIPMTLNAFDGDFRAAAENIAEVDHGERQSTLLSTDALSRNALFLLLTRQAKSVSGGTRGYEHLELWNAECAFLAGSMNTQEAGSRGWLLTANNSDVLPDGQAVDAIYTDAPNGRGIGRYFRSQYRLSYSILIGNNSLVKVITTHKPVSTAKSNLSLETTGFASDTVASIVTTAPFGVNATTTPGSGKALISTYEFINFAS